MVKMNCFKYIFVALGVMLLSIANGQRLNIGLSGAFIPYASTQTHFESPITYLYDAPFAVPRDDESFFQTTEVFNQVRLAKIWGIGSRLQNNLKLGGHLNYQGSNNLNIRLAVSFFSSVDDVFYSFQNMVVNLSEDDALISNYGDNLELADEFVSVNRALSDYGIAVSYRFPIKWKVSPYLLIGMTQRVQLYSDYSSQTTKTDPTVLDRDDLVAFSNNKVFQDELFAQASTDGFNTYYNYGLGAQLYGWSIELVAHSSFGSNRSPYFEGQQFAEIRLNYDLISIPLFR